MGEGREGREESCVSVERVSGYGVVARRCRARLGVFSHCVWCLFSQLRSWDCRSLSRQCVREALLNSSQKAATSVRVRRC